MAHSFEVAYTREDVSAGVRYYVNRRFRHWRWKFALVIFAGSAPALTCIVAPEQRVWFLFVALAGSIGTGLAMPSIFYRAAVKQTLAGVAKFESPVGTATATDETLCLRADTGATEPVWRLIEEVWEQPRVWLFLLGKSPYLIVPISQASEEDKAFIREKVTAAGGKVS
ncbi:MAG TPA: hypothetical protein VGM37_15920 [Armatimonadota bacterium]|jgi:hypothetical protein